MFQKNLEVLKNKNPKLAQKLQAVSIEEAKKDIAVYNAESGDIIISYKDIPLHSVYDPMREAKTTWNKAIAYEAGKNDMQVIFGLGLGYLFKRAFVNAPSRIIIFEPFINILRFVLEFIDFSNEIAGNRVYISDNMEECLEYIKRKYLGDDKIEVLFLNSYSKIAQNELLHFSSKLLEVCRLRKMDNQTIMNQCRNWTINNINNLKEYNKVRAVNYIERCFEDKTALLVSAGPSLNNDIEAIKNNRNKFVLISVNKAVKTLVNNGISPDFVVFADGAHIANFMGDERSKLTNSNLIIGSRADHFAYTIPSNTKFVYYSNTDSLGEYVEKLTRGKIKAYESAGTTSIVSYLLAKEMGFSKFIFSGLDLAFTENKMYPDVELELDAKGKIPDHLNTETLKVKDINGNDILTRADYALFIRQLEEILENETNKNIFNTSKGAFVKGMNYISLQEALAGSEKITFDINSAMREIENNTKQEWLTLKNDITNLISEEKKQMSNIKNVVLDLLPILTEINKNIEYNGNIQGLEEIVQQSLEWSAKAIEAILNTMFLSQYIQNELFSLVNKQNKSIFTDLKDYKAKLQAEIAFYNELNLAIDTLRNIPNNPYVSPILK